ncbi:MAG: endonuclease/exonuclease/phosphatase family protein [Planctomycetota bacterium]|nr:MAG: endonuclease/exonuclease/phosphatase family protein [Planctomycetota bacterium]
MHHLPGILMAVMLLALPGCRSATPVRIMTFNAEDIRPADVSSPEHPRLEAIASVIESLDPDILLLQEIARDAAGVNAQRFADRWLPDSGYTAFMPETNTGIPSGHDLDRSGQAVTEYPLPEPSGPDGAPPPQTDDQRAYGNDCFGFGTFPGQYGMALLVSPRCKILYDQVRTYRLFRWSKLPGARSPESPDGTPWYPPEVWEVLRLPSKTLADIPVRLPDGSVIHCVVSHPTPPAFDGPEGRNKIRNRDEIRLLRAFLDNEPWLVDDAGRRGGLPPGALAIVMGDLNADPIDGSSIDDPIGHLLASPRLATDPVPSSPVPVDRLDATDTAMFRLRVDYILPTKGVEVVDAGIWRPESIETHPSDHFPVWADIVVPRTKRSPTP